jgi:hypothetical protein
MAQLQEIFDRIKESKKEQKEIKTIYRDALATSSEYEDIVEELKTLKERKKTIEGDIRSQFSSELDKLESIKLDIATDNEMLSDIALNQLVKGEKLALTDEYDNEYEPSFSVRFKKI